MTDGIVWEDPPVTAGGFGGINWGDVLAPLKDYPGRWALVHTGDPKKVRTKASNLTRGNVARGRVEPSEWEFVSRTVDGEGRMYARYLGPKG